VATVNWEAYSHEELYRMLWEDADVADVSMVAIEWARHRAALDTHAEVLREQRAALLDSWQGPAAEEAAARLAALAARVEKISALAAAGQQAAQDAADALATARAMMPPPPADPAAAFTGAPFTGGTDGLASWSPAAPWLVGATGVAPPLPAPPSPPQAPFAPPIADFLPTFAAMAPPPPPPPSFSPASFSPVPSFVPPSGTAGFSFYFGAVGSDQQKAQAVRAMQAYESSLAGSGRLIDEARGAIPPAAPSPRATSAQAATAASTGGVPWTRLLGGGAGRVPGVGSGGGTGAGIGSVGGTPEGSSAGSPLGSGQRVGVAPGTAGAPGMAGVPRAQETGARGVAHGGVAPPVSGRRADDETHENQLPTIDHGLFVVEMPTSPPVIGVETGVRP
jgi:hypothetical protein